jgi:hypothetical protein
VLPRSQAVAIAVTIVVLASLVLAWTWLGAWTVVKHAGWTRRSSWVDHPAARYPLVALLVLVPLLLLYSRYLEPRWVRVREVALGRELRLHRGAPEGREQAQLPGQPPVRIAVISDLHIEGKRRPWTHLAEIVNSAGPDVILFLGDTLNRSRALPALRDTLRAMRAPHGKLAVRGNWEAWYWNYLPLLRGTGFTWLDGDGVTLRIRGQTLALVGLPFDEDEDGVEGQRLLNAAARGSWRIFLYHTPDLVEAVPAADLYLAGHTHGGQISIPFFGALVTLSKYGKRFERGMHQVGHTRLYVTPGIGVEPLIPLRLGVRPEVTIIKLGAK